MNPFLLAIALLPGQPPAAPDFAREVRPLLSDRCFKCHGPGTAKAGRRLDRRDDALDVLSPGKPDKSEFLRRIDSHDAGERMPPGGKAKPLTAAERATLRAWVAAGARYDPHWAYVKPVRPAVPAGVNPIDHFVRERLTRAGLEPSPPAAAETLCRRLHLDLIGLPPSPEDVDAFVTDAAKDNRAAAEALADRLLASPRFGEKWARHWLDLARYGDSAGYQHDDDMPLWLFRDYVIRAFNADLPFDRFTTEQIAGDLLPSATLDQKIATGFHRCATVTLGADQNAEELRAQLVWDRVNTVGTTWLAASLECAQCHAHKFDPISHTDYYRLYAYFDGTVPELTKEPGSHYFITGGVLELPADAATAARVRELTAAMDREVAAMLKVGIDLDTAPATFRRIATGPAEFRTAERVYYYLTEEFRGTGPKEVAAHVARIRQLGRELTRVRPPRALVLEEAKVAPATRVFLRGNVRTPGEPVPPGTPAALHPLPKDAPANRLGLAQWLTSRDNPLTARVTVNRWWAELFGTGLVTTTEDFGLQGEYPSHPELLDWLAVEFMDGGWRMKRVLKHIVLSETYQQSSRVTAAHRAKDPDNRLLSRGPRFRLDAELLRDNALAAAGLLKHELGGRPAYPTPAAAKAAKAEFTWRRGVYVRQQRGDPYATFAAFDAPDRFACAARRPRTNTPLQALAVLNEPAFAEAAAALAARVTRELPEAAFAARATRLFRLCTARRPTADELTTLHTLFDKTVRDGADEVTVWRLVATVALNLDETLTKE
ncbi:MAG: hypothetical protein C0501_28865 [Isosphaera sp.]|nr:hypothetical protein [Isosphaera sp.]